MDMPSSACSTITFSARKILIAGYYRILHELFINFFYTMKQVLKGTRKRMTKGLVVTFTLLILMMVSLLTVSLITIINSLIAKVMLEHLIH